MPRRLPAHLLLEIARSEESQRKLSARLSISDHTVKRVRAAMTRAGLGRGATLDEVANAVYKPTPASPRLLSRHPDPDYPEIMDQRASGLTLEDCWRIYRKEHPNGFRFSRFAALVKQHATPATDYVPIHKPVMVPLGPHSVTVPSESLLPRSGGSRRGPKGE